MIATVEAFQCKCEKCGREFLRTDLPVRCPNSRCRSVTWKKRGRSKAARQRDAQVLEIARMDVPLEQKIEAIEQMPDKHETPPNELSYGGVDLLSAFSARKVF